MLNILKRNIGFVVFLLVCVILAVALWTVSGRIGSEVEELAEEYSDHQSYFSRVAERRPGVTDENLRQARENLEQLENELSKLKQALAERSVLEVESVSAVEAKNQLDSVARSLRSEFEQAGVEVHDDARGFSFQEIIQAPGLPEASREAPALMRQLRVVERVAELVAGSGVEEVRSLHRPAGIREIHKDGYRVMRINLELRGSLGNIRSLINQLHAEQDFYFNVPYFQWRGEELEIQRDSDRRSDRSRSRDDRRGDREVDSEEEAVRERRLVRFDDSVSFEMPIHFIEFDVE